MREGKKKNVDPNTQNRKWQASPKELPFDLSGISFRRKMTEPSPTHHDLHVLDLRFFFFFEVRFNMLSDIF